MFHAQRIVVDVLHLPVNHAVSFRQANVGTKQRKHHSGPGQAPTHPLLSAFILEATQDMSYYFRLETIRRTVRSTEMSGMVILRFEIVAVLRYACDAIICLS
jgi:hypothetical protein